MNVFFKFIEEIGLLIAVIFSSALIINIVLRICTGSVKQLTKLIELLENNIKSIRKEVKEIREDADQCLTCPEKANCKRFKKQYDDAQ